MDWEKQRATCPNGAVSRNWRQARSKEGLPIIHVTFRLPDCAPCPVRARCTRSTPGARGAHRPRATFSARSFAGDLLAVDVGHACRLDEELEAFVDV
ncbi:transposase [Streptomyces sp. NPDC058231]|uniref:transposase n=1 Tax=Streptomyces sp. NPDC058231 TaxID=3346392 RepID=UPI0036DFE9FE